MNLKRIILSRTDSIGDVMLTLPMAGYLKEKYPDIEIIFLGKKYTEAVISCCSHVDRFIDFDSWKSNLEGVTALRALQVDAIIHVLPNLKIAKIAKSAGIPLRIGTGRRWFHKLYCNSRIPLSRRNSDLHESQLNLLLLGEFGPVAPPDLRKVSSLLDFSPKAELPQKLKEQLNEYDRKIILHPKSQGSAREWGLKNFSELMRKLQDQGIGVFVTGTQKEGELLDSLPFSECSNAHNMTGKMTLPELIAFIDQCDGLVAASTGPLHIAAALGVRSVGLYSPIRPIHPGRWGAIGINAVNLTFNGSLEKNATVKNDHSIEKITPMEVLTALGLDHLA